jgi:hypothetical protein
MSLVAVCWLAAYCAVHVWWAGISGYTVWGAGLLVAAASYVIMTKPLCPDFS